MLELLRNSIVPFFLIFPTDELEKKMSSVIVLSGGMPNPNYFPITAASVSLGDGTTLEIGEELMRRALQYAASEGYLSQVIHSVS